ncbi:MAG: ABC transporter substrate-binding protein [Sphingobium sp.]
MNIARSLAKTCLPLLMAMPAACSDEGSGPVVVSVIGERADFARPLQRLPAPGAKLFLETTAQGLVAFDATGDILPALAQRWIVEDDGRSYIFRLRRAFWANGTRVTARDVAPMLEMRIDALRRIDPDGPLDAVDAVVPMTGEVIEIRLLAARPQILQMLAQPQMAILSRDGGAGPYRAARRGSALFLTPADPPASADGDEDGPVPATQMRVLRAERSAMAIVRYRQGEAALVLGGRFSDLPLLVSADIDRGEVRLDPVRGLLGLAVVGKDALLDDDGVRAAINMAIDRSQLPRYFPLGGWETTDQLLPGQLDLAAPIAPPPWSATPIDQRRIAARALVDRWRRDHGAPAALRVALPNGPGATLLFGLIRHDLAAIGLDARRVGMADKADLLLIDEVAAYDSALWYLGRIGCVRAVHCDDQADALLHALGGAGSDEVRAARLGEVAALVQAHNGYIPLGTPVRWSLVSPRLTGFSPSTRARHPLNHLFRSTN